MMNMDSIYSYIDNNRQRLFDTLCELIRFDTQNLGHSGNERPMAEYIGKRLAAAGIESDIYSPDSVPGIKQHPEYLSGRGLENRTNITGVIPGKNSVKALMLAAHMDTVPAGDTALWEVPPFDGVIKDGKIYGRGACDDKYAVAVWLFLAEMYRGMGIGLNNTVYLTGYVDEEFGGGDGALACCLKYPADFYLNMDCKNLDIWNCAVGGQRLVIELCHSDIRNSCENVLNGIIAAKKTLDEFGRRRKRELSENPFFSGSSICGDAFRYMSVSTGINQTDRNRGSIDIAFYTDKSGAEIRSELEAVFGSISEAVAPYGLHIDRVDHRSRFFNYGYISGDSEVISLLRAAGKENGRDLRISPSCLSDLSIFLNCAPGRAVSFGAGRDFDVPGGAHLADEFIECDDLVEYTKIIADFIMKWDAANDRKQYN